MQPDNERSQWHLDKTISIGHILSTIIIGFSLLSWALAVDKRVEQNAQHIQFLYDNEKRIEERVEATRDEIRQDLRNIGGKLDRLIERQLRDKQN
ncbi:hypothetical protein CS022_22530 [Veronia nyctiphanis]|uniref:Uncharacterized protein n=1 Tax=Veronia nyctiphanis TaxID=1278244 RepID=A0A4Q0YJ18_9GAMM|nr:hypothetical protein [Veronia nyctiphanis]RXJ70646.1 hypothetical protein CS022_22530 [Veronia nyctiphanis]